MRLVALNACVVQTQWYLGEAVANPVLLQRLSVFSAVISCVDGGGRKLLLHNAWIATQCPWECFHAGNYADICSQVLRKRRGQKYEPWAVPEPHMRTLTIRVAQWIHRNNVSIQRLFGSAPDVWNSAYQYFKLELRKYLLLGNQGAMQ